MRWACANYTFAADLTLYAQGERAPHSGGIGSSETPMASMVPQLAAIGLKIPGVCSLRAQGEIPPRLWIASPRRGLLLLSSHYRSPVLHVTLERDSER